MHVAILSFRRLLPIFADVCRFLQIFAFFAFFELIFRAPRAVFCILAQHLDKLDPGAVFVLRECFFRIPRVFIIDLA